MLYVSMAPAEIVRTVEGVEIADVVDMLPGWLCIFCVGGEVL